MPKSSSSPSSRAENVLKRDDTATHSTSTAFTSKLTDESEAEEPEKRGTGLSVAGVDAAGTIALQEVHSTGSAAELVIIRLTRVGNMHRKRRERGLMARAGRAKVGLKP